MIIGYLDPWGKSQVAELQGAAAIAEETKWYQLKALTGHPH